MELDDRVIRTLKVLLVIGAVVLAGGTGLLVWLLARGGPTPGAAVTGPQPLLVPPGFRAESVAFAEGRVLLSGRAGDGRQVVIVADPAKPEAARILLLTPQP